MSTVYKPPVNFRPTPTRVNQPEAFVISGGLALLTEAPADPSTYPPTILVGGVSRTRVDTTPAVGQYRILTQAIVGVGIEWLPVLQFNTADEGLTGTADYYGTGTLITTQFFVMLQSFLSPILDYVDVGGLPTPTINPLLRGRPGDVAFLRDGSGFFSDGVVWNPFVVSSGVRGTLLLGEALALALDAGYIGPSFNVSPPAFLGAYVLSFDGAFGPPVFGDITFASLFDFNSSALAGIPQFADITIAQAFGMTLDGVLGLIASMPNFAATFAESSDATFAGSFVPLAVSDNFDRTPGALGSNWSTAYGRSGFSIITGGYATPNVNGPCGITYNGNFSGDHYSEGFGWWPNQSSGTNQSALLGCAVAVRMQSNADSFYCASVYYNNAQQRVFLAKVINGVFTNLAEVPALSETYVRLNVWGSTIFVQTSGNASNAYMTPRIMLTDTDLSGGKPGIVADGPAVHTSGYADVWYGGDTLDWSDTFVPVARTTLGFNWSLLTGGFWTASYPQTSGGNSAIGSPSAGYAAAAISAPVFLTDQYAECWCQVALAGPVVRFGASQGYWAYLLPTGDDGDGGPTAWTVTLKKWDGTSFTTLATYPGSPVSETTIKLVVQFNTLKVYTVNGHGGTYNQRISITDSSYPSGGAPGFCTQNAGYGQPKLAYWFGGGFLG